MNIITQETERIQTDVVDEWRQCVCGRGLNEMIHIKRGGLMSGEMLR
jgi:hypothetical protein